MRVGDLVRFKDPDHPAGYPYLKEAGIVTGWAKEERHTLGTKCYPVVYFPSTEKTFLASALEVINESR